MFNQTRLGSGLRAVGTRRTWPEGMRPREECTAEAVLLVLERERVLLAGGGEERWDVELLEAAAREAFWDRVVTMA